MALLRFRTGPSQFSSRVEPADGRALIEEFGRVGSWATIIEDQLTWWSDGVYDLFAVPRDLALVPRHEDFFLAGSADLLAAAFKRAAETGEGWTIEAPFRDARGRESWIRSTGNVRRTADGKTMLMGMLQDVSQSRRLEERLVAERRFVETILDNIPHMIFVKEAKDLKFVRFNAAGERLLGVASTNLIGKNDFDLFPADQAAFFVNKDRQTMAASLPLDIPEESIDTLHGRKILHTKKITIRDEAGEPAYLLGISEDITDRIAHEATIAKQRAALAGSARLSALGQMAGGIAHEINNPLAILRGAGEQLQYLLDVGTVDRERMSKLTGTITRTVDRIAKIIVGLRDFSRDGTHDPMDHVGVKALVMETLSLSGEKLRLAGVKVDVDGIPDDLKIRCQAVRLSQVLLNLVTNAFDAMADAVCDRREIRIAARGTSGGPVEIEVADTGPGVPAELAESIMLPFFTTKGPGKGTGLGLSISKGICEAHGGSLALVGSESGACFVIRLPAATLSDKGPVP